MLKKSNIYSYGVICPPFTGHIYPMLSLALEIKKRGYDVTLFYYIPNKYLIKANQLGINTVSVCTHVESNNILHELEALSKLVGWKANHQTMHILEIVAGFNLRYLNDKITNANCDALLIDQTMLEGESISSSVNLPFVNICNALMLNPDLNVPPLFNGLKYKSSFIGKIRNFFAYLYVGIRSQGNKILKLVSQFREQETLSRYPSRFDKKFLTVLWSKSATISQQPPEFEFPRSTLSKNFYFTGPFINSQLREEISFPWEKLNGKPLIYASLGTLQNAIGNIFIKIAQACIGIDCQLVISFGKRNITEQKIFIDRLPVDAIVVDYAPQLKLLEKASLCITHAGINTTLESLNNGVPMVAIPIANDQPGVSARIEWTGTGKVTKYNCSSKKLNKAIREVLSDDSYRQNAVKMKKIMDNSGGIEKAANIIESVMNQKPTVKSTS